MLWKHFRKELLFVTIYLIEELFSILNWGTFLQKEARKPWSYSGIETLLTHLITEVIPDLFVLLRVRLIGEFDTNAEVWWGGSVQSPYFCNCFSFVLQLLVILKLKLVISETLRPQYLESSLYLSHRSWSRSHKSWSKMWHRFEFVIKTGTSREQWQICDQMQKARPANNSNVLLGNPSHGGGIGPHTVQSFWMQLEETPMLFLLKSKLVFTHPSVCELLSFCWCRAPRPNSNKKIANILFSLCPCRGYSHAIKISWVQSWAELVILIDLFFDFVYWLVCGELVGGKCQVQGLLTCPHQSKVSRLCLIQSKLLADKCSQSLLISWIGPLSEKEKHKESILKPREKRCYIQSFQNWSYCTFFYWPIAEWALL